MAKGDDALAVLISIDATLKALLALSEKRTSAVKPTTVQGPAIADARDLDSAYGDPEVKFKLRDWHGEDFKGQRFSNTSAVFLDQLALSFDYFAEKNDAAQAKTDKGVLKSVYDRKSAARARGWAARLRNGTKPVAMESPGDWGSETGGKW